MKYYKNCVVLFAVMLFLLASLAPALAVRREPIVRSDAEYPSTPEKVVEEYVRKDAEGYRLSGDKFRYMRDLYMWEEAGTDVFIAITGYDIKPMDMDSNSAHVQVSYRELGEFSPWEWRQDKRELVITFVLKRDGNRWRISEPETFPHVLVDVLMADLERNVAMDYYADENRTVLRQLRKTITEEPNGR